MMETIQGGGCKEFRVFGPPGTGKTTWLVKQVRRAAEKYGGDRVLCCSFTKAAATEMVTRITLPDEEPLIPDRSVGTLHAICYRALGSPTLAETKISQWNAEHPELELSKRSAARVMEDGLDEADTSEEGGADALLAMYSTLRNRLIPFEDMPAQVQHFAKLWEGWKRDYDFMDFTDLLVSGSRELHYPPNGASVAFVDEAQDMTPLQLKVVRNWEKSLQFYILVGDDDQCQPAGTQVLTMRGYLPIEELDPQRHRLVCFSRQSGYLVKNGRAGYSFEIARREYSGTLYRVQAGGTSTRATHNHKWIARWTEEAKASKACIVYLMRRGEDFRVGWWQLFRSDKIFHLGHRARLERADEAWILRVCEDREEASIEESLVAARYGLSTAPFRPHGRMLYTERGLEKLFSGLRDCSVGRARAALEAYGRNIAFPLWRQKDMFMRRSGNAVWEVASCNLLEGLMLIPVAHGEAARSVTWEPFTIEKEPLRNPVTVYSLDVEPHHTYVADGLVTHNCIYRFSGASPDALITGDIPQENKIILKQSWRVPASVHRLAEKWIKKVSVREPKEYLPTEREGAVRRLPGATVKDARPAVRDAVNQIAAGRTVMFLTACSYHLRASVIPLLKEHGVPFWNPYRVTQGEWNPLRGRKRDLLASYLEPDGPELGGTRFWSAAQLARWSASCAFEGLFKRGARTRIEALSRRKNITEDEVLDFYTDWFEPQGLDAAMSLSTAWLERQLKPDKAKGLAFPLSVLRRGGWEALDAKPRCIVGTIHSVKGGEADVVYLFPDISPQSYEGILRGTEGRDAVIRQFYVGMTRAREELVVCNAATLYNTMAIR